MVHLENDATEWMQCGVNYIERFKNADGSFRVCFLSKLGRLVLVIPHSNAGEEHVFNLMKQNKTPTRSSLSTNVISSKMKLANGNSCIKWNPPKNLLATKPYNDAQKTKF